MLLEESIVVGCPPDEVWAYLSDISNVSKWDRGVARTQPTSSDSPGIGFRFDTLAHSRGNAEIEDSGKMSYQITETDAVRGCTVKLTSSTGNARFFKSAEWRFRVDSVPGGSRVFCAAHFTVRIRYLILAPVLYAMKKGIRKDLESLKRAVEQS